MALFEIQSRKSAGTASAIRAWGMSLLFFALMPGLLTASARPVSLKPETPTRGESTPEDDVSCRELSGITTCRRRRAEFHLSPTGIAVPSAREKSSGLPAPQRFLANGSAERCLPMLC